MNTTAIILILLVAYLVYNIQDQHGGTLKQMTINKDYQGPYYARQYRELDDVDNVLNRLVYPRDEVTQRLIPHNKPEQTPGTGPACSDQYHDIAHLALPDSTIVLVEGQQPYFLDGSGPLVLDRYGKKFYWDARYPKQPISVEFAENPEKYVKDHPNEYPSYVIKSRDYSRLGSHFSALLTL